MTADQILQARIRTQKILADAGIVLTADESQRIEIADFGLNRLEEEGLEIITYINNERYCAKELVMFPNQTCPEHRHPAIDTNPGKRETLRVRSGLVRLCVEGTASPSLRAIVPAKSRKHYTVFHEIELRPGEQHTIAPNTLHWFQAAEWGAIISEFSSPSHDDRDIFTDPRIRRIAPTIADE